MKGDVIRHHQMLHAMVKRHNITHNHRQDFRHLDIDTISAQQDGMQEFDTQAHHLGSQVRGLNRM